MKTLKITRNKSFEWSLGIHIGVLMLGFLPLMHKINAPQPIEYLVEVGWEEFPEIQEAGSEGLKAMSPIFNEEPEPTTDQPTNDPIPVDETEPVKEITIAEEVSQIESDVVTDSETDVVASSSSDHGADAETHAQGGGNGSPIEGNQDGGAMAGDGGAGDGLEGDGIITRKIIYRENISKVAKVNGKIVLNICINRMGQVEYAGYDAAKTTITDKAIIKEATEIASRYRFESKYNAPKRECGQLTFIFSIEEPIEPVWE
ncbi:MAG TPA: hypothetical protein VMZ69_11210 [Saprospiraceae bacterium]|nr:hypothetical protein [Saprospiraceae bacterium]